MSATTSQTFALAIALAIAGNAAAHAVTFDWVTIGEPGNPPWSGNQPWSHSLGAVHYTYQLSRFETTNAQYAEFLNAVAQSDPHALYDPSMESDASNGGIVRSGTPGSFTYAVKPGSENKPVTYVSFWDALRFANWLHNGQQSDPATTQHGAYTLTPATIASNGVVRNPGASIFLPDHDEWVKAAYYEGGGTYFLYPAGLDDEMQCVPPTATPNTANCGIGAGQVTSVGSYPNSPAPSGTFDQGGNVNEWLDTNWDDDALEPQLRTVAGGSFDEDGYTLYVGQVGNSAMPSFQEKSTGFRVARLAPAVPAIGPVGALALFGLLVGAAVPAFRALVSSSPHARRPS